MSKLIRRKRCGSYFTAHGRQCQYYCSDFRHCQRCFNKRVELEFNGIYKHMTEIDPACTLYLTVVDNEHEAANLTTWLRRRKVLYRRYPHDGKITLLHTSDELGFEKVHRLINEDTLMELLPVLVNTTLGQCMSGKLGSTKSVDPDHDLPTVRVKAVWTDAPLFVEREVLVETLEEALDFSECKSAEEYEANWALYDDIFQEKIRSRGYEVKSVVTIKKRITRDLNWSKEILGLLFPHNRQRLQFQPDLELETV